MNQYFTTSEFADLLKEFGIEIKTFYYSFLLKYEDDLTNIMFGMYSASLGRYVATNGWTYNEDDVEQVKPAYLLQQVLEWLPDRLLDYLRPTNTPSHTPDYLAYPIIVRNELLTKNILVGYRSQTYGTKITPQPIEQLITQGLNEGWLTKETILNNSKPL